MVVGCLPNQWCNTGPFSGSDAHVASSGAFVGSWRVHLVLSRQPPAGAGITPVGWLAKDLSCFTAARLGLYPRRFLAERGGIHGGDHPRCPNRGGPRPDEVGKIAGYALSICYALGCAAQGGTRDRPAIRLRIAQHAQGEFY